MTDRRKEMLAVLDRVEVVCSAEDEDRLLDTLAAPDRPMVLSFLNQHAFNLAFADTAMRQALAASDVLLRDGVGIEACMKLLRRAPGRNLNGTDLIPRLLARAVGQPIALYGTREPWLTLAADRMRAAGHRIVGLADGFQAVAAYAGLAAETSPSIIILAMGMPKQEAVSLALRAALTAPCLIINGGAIVDFFAGRQPRAPKWVQEMRLEWLFRLAREPRRLAGRYLGGGFVFLSRVIALRAYSQDAGQ